MEALKGSAEHRVILHNTSWETYERLLEERGEERVPRFFYDRGELEIVSPSAEHERVGYYVGLIVAMFAREGRVGIYGVGSTTFRREDLARGFEPDLAFYTRNREQVRGKSRLNLEVDPPPDLVVEIDVTHLSIDKLSIYAQAGVPEVWRYEGNRFDILLLGERDYERSDASLALPSVTDEALRILVEYSASMELAEWLDRVIEWAQGNTEPSG
jgi:Uma2 family endonuclease